MLLNYMRKKNILKSAWLIFSFILFNINAVAQGDIQASSESSNLSQICEHSLGSKESFLQKMNLEKENIKNAKTVKTKLIAKDVHKINTTPPKSLYFASSEEIRAYENKIKKDKIQAEKLKAQKFAQQQQQEKEQILILATKNQEHQNKVDRCLQS